VTLNKICEIAHCVMFTWCKTSRK